jgi:YesN/AraC family two-component response regulator
MESTAEAFGLSAGYLGKLYKSVTGASFNESLTELRMEKAASLLRETALPANKVSERVGIANVTYFSTLFKKNFGVSPSQYREKNPAGG